ncbi:MAG: type I-E CRISPR-associated protein Cas5/CasD [Gemmatimonadetes bacterium]|nr:type I-E CRISPR-associated protein Cas5/CasD [Gemmatimonadota bacterium]
MSEFLLFTVYAPMASWGDIAMGELRGSWDRPSRSAMLGLVAAALGLDRSDQARHDALDAGYGVATRQDRPGGTMVDYHTVQTVRASVVKKARPCRTRGELLALADPETMLSQRTYREDALATVALWPRAGEWPLAALAEQLRHPGYVLYAGRKANPLGLPLDPQVVAAASLAAAFAARKAPVGLEWPRRLPEAIQPEISHDPCEDFPSGLRLLRSEVRRDAGAHRGRWQFAERTVEVGVPLAGEAG